MLSTRTLQRWFKPLERTPLHPQFLVLRHRTEMGDWIRQHAEGTLVDIGCGNGRLREQLPTGVRYVGVDYPTTMALGYEGSPDILADASHLPIAADSADVVTLLDVLEHMRNPDGALSEIARILRPGGSCLIHVPFMYPLHDEPHDYTRWTRHGLQDILERNGLSASVVTESLPAVTTAAALFAIALASAAVDSARNPSPALLLTIVTVPLIPLINIAGWLLGKLSPGKPIMPFSYRVLATRKG